MEFLRFSEVFELLQLEEFPFLDFLWLQVMVVSSIGFLGFLVFLHTQSLSSFAKRFPWRISTNWFIAFVFRPTRVGHLGAHGCGFYLSLWNLLRPRGVKISPSSVYFLQFSGNCMFLVICNIVEISKFLEIESFSSFQHFKVFKFFQNLEFSSFWTFYEIQNFSIFQNF